jgi:microcystin-dependent protein
MANYEATKFNFNGSNLSGIEGIPTATIVPWSDSSIPSGFLECNGAAVSRSTYSALFAIVGTTYGTGDGSSTFNVPDLQDKLPVSKSNNKALGSTGGAETVQSTGNVGGSTGTHAITTPELAGHTHTGAGGSPKTLGGGPSGYGNPQSVSNAGGGATGSTGSGTAHSHNMSATFTGGSDSVLQPFLALIYIIKT